MQPLHMILNDLAPFAMATVFVPDQTIYRFLTTAISGLITSDFPWVHHAGFLTGEEVG